jgi:hypothetical protein
MTQTPLSQDTAAPNEVAAGLREAGPLNRRPTRLPLHPMQRLGLTAGAFLYSASPAPPSRR